jgi:hypothetical protein
MPDKHSFQRIADEGDEAILLAANIEHDKISDVIRTGEHAFHLSKGQEGFVFDDPIPVL